VATLPAVVSALATTLAAIPGLTGYDAWTLKPVPPFAMPRFLGDADSADTFDGRCTYRFEVVFGVSAVDFPAAQRALYAFASRSGTNSILAALEANPTLGGVAETLMVHDLTGPLESVEIGGVEFLTGARAVDVLVMVP
jgi:hypothetical protein